MAVSRASSREPAPVPGTRPAGTQDEGQAAARVREMFSRIAPRYDLLNHLLSFSLDRVWRWRAARRFRDILARSDARVLDVCCGTGDLALALQRRAATEARRHRETTGARIWGSDFAHPMLVRAREKRAEGTIQYLEADALKLPFADASFDLVTSAFGFRNLANYEAGLREMQRVLKPGGMVGILEFAAPDDTFFAALYRFYFTKILPRIGGAISGSNEAYSYLPSSVSRFPSPDDLCAMMRDAGLADARSELWSAGIVALHTARKA